MLRLDSRKNDTKFNTEEAGEGDEEVGVVTATKVSRPKMYKVLLHNDDYTTMEFVIGILQGIFQKNTAEAESIMLEVHEKGSGVCGVYTYEVAETKQSTVLRMAKEEGHPLKCTVAPE